MKLFKLFLFAIIINITLLSSNPVNYYIVQAGLTDSVCKLFNEEVKEEWEGDDPEIEKLMERDKTYYVDPTDPEDKNLIPYRPKKTTIDLNCAPPWHRYTGRTGCLLRYPVDKLGATFSKAMYCAEAIDDDTSNDPKLRVRAQFCNTFACWVMDDILTHGKCSLFAGSWGANTVRLCARIAYPNMSSDKTGIAYPNMSSDTKGVTDAKDNISEDPSCWHDQDDEPGYTRCIHVDERGRQRVDRLIEVKDKSTEEIKKKRILAPKLCLYNDPWLYNPKLLLGIVAAFAFVDDPLDWNPTYQIEHQYGYKFIKSPAYIKALMQKRGQQLSDEQIAALAINKSEVKKFNLDIGSISSSIMNYISLLVDNLKTYYNNSVVSKEVLGCVELPLGVSPPPFYDTLNRDNYTLEIKVQQICSLDQIKDTITNINSACILSDSRNNVIHNSVRVMENNLLPICPNDNSDKTQERFNAGECIKIHLPVLHNALNIHEDLKDNVPLCNESASNTPCIIHKNPSLVTKNFRVMYTTVLNGDEGGYSASPQNFNYCVPLCAQHQRQCPAQISKLLDNKVDCCVNYKGVCQRVWGVNAGSYTDVELDFNTPAGQNNNDASLNDNVLFNKFDFQGRRLMALITRRHIDIQPEFLQNLNSAPSKKVTKILHRQKPEEICIYDITNKHKLIGCVPRAERPIPRVKACRDSSGNHFKPKIGIQLAAKKNNTSSDLDILEGCVEAPNIHHNTRTSINTNLAGYNYSAYVTDEYDSIIDDTNNKGEILGKHYNAGDDQKDHNTIYLGGFEKKDYAYVSGGKLICVDSNNIGYSCSPRGNELHKSLCVLPKKIQNSLSRSVEDREDPKFDKNQCMPSSKDYPKCLKLDENHYYKLPEGILDRKPDKQLEDIMARIRTKNSLELGLCIKIPEMPDCKGLTDKYTIWSDAKVGEESIGKCKPSDSQYDYIASPSEQDLRRLCYFDSAKPNSDIYFTTGDSATPVLGASKGECKQVARKCKAEEINGIIWPETEAGKSATPRCAKPDYKLTSNNKTERRCIFDSKDNEYKLETIPAGVKCRRETNMYISDSIKTETWTLGLKIVDDDDDKLYDGYITEIEGQKAFKFKVVGSPDNVLEIEFALQHSTRPDHADENIDIEFRFLDLSNQFTSIMLSGNRSLNLKYTREGGSMFLKIQPGSNGISMDDSRNGTLFVDKVTVELERPLRRGEEFLVRRVQK